VNIDNAMKWGFGWEKGPFESWDAIGVQKSVDRMKTEGKKVPSWILDMLESGRDTFYTTENGEQVGSTMMRNSRLMEVLMDSALKVEIDEEMVCGIEHHMSKQFTDAMCTMLNHPRKCPHDHKIPKGECCEKTNSD